MIAIPSRHRSLVLLATILAGQVFLLAIQIRREPQGRLIRVWTISLISPFERAGAWGVTHVRGAWRHYIALRGERRENEQLRQEVETLKLRVQQLEGRAAEVDRLSTLLAFRQAHAETPLLAARVIGAGVDPTSQLIYIDRGARDGVRRNMGVITPDGAVGKVIEVFRDTAQVLLITDKESGVGAMLSDSRVQAPVGGTGEPLLVMKYISSEEKVAVGARVVTSGMDRIFPAGIPVGYVTEAKPGYPFEQVRVKPAAQLDRLEAVFVLLTLQPLETKTEAAGPSPTSAAPASSAAAPSPSDRPAQSGPSPARAGVTPPPKSPAPGAPR
ncbi:MAG: rod shape-determining protein MreC [Candidatus Acidiferrales bacterium]|jgi:rod shape-determining protein MreC